MATKTPNLNLNLFEGSERPNKDLFNENNQIIDGILTNASTHNHDGVNAAKITAKNVVFDKGETTLASTNLEDAVKEVFTEADNKITWITNAIGTTEIGNLSDPDKRFDEINTDFIAARTKYRDDMSKVNKFIIETGMPDSSASLNEIADAINNTVISGVTATKEDIVADKTSITKYGVVEQGSLGTILEHKQFLPKKDVDVSIPRGIYADITLAGTGVNPELIIRKDINIMGVIGQAEERGSNGWDIGELIEKRKTTAFNSQECYIKALNSSIASDANFSLPYTILVTDSSNPLRKVDAQHFIISNMTSSQVNVACYDANFKSYAEKSISTKSFMSFKKNKFTNQSLFYVGRYDNNSDKYSYAVCVGSADSSNIYKSEIAIMNLSTSGKIVDVVVDFDIIDIVYPDPKILEFKNDVLLIGQRSNGMYVYSTVIFNYDGTANVYIKDMPNVPFVETEKGKSIYFVPNYSTTELSPITENKCICKVLSTGDILLGADDKLVFNNIHSTNSITLKLKSYSASNAYNIKRIDGTIIESGVVSGTKEVILNTTGLPSNYFSIESPTGLYVQDVLENGMSIISNRIYRNLKPLMQVFFTEQRNKPIYLWGATEYNPEANSCISTLVADAPINMFNNLEKELQHYYKMTINSFNLTDNTRNVKDGSLSTNWFYGQDNMLFSSWMDYIEYRTSATGAKWYRHNRDLIRLNYVAGLGNDFTLTYTKMQTGTSYKPFRPCFIDSKNRVMGIERSCTPDKFEYFCVLDSNLKGLYQYKQWSETTMRNVDDDLFVLDENTTLYGQAFITNMKYCYGENGVKDTRKLIGNVLQRKIANSTLSADYIQSVDKDYANNKCGPAALFTNMYRINATRY